MPIEATVPTTVQATYDKWAVQFRTDGFPAAAFGADAVGTVSCTVVMRRYRLRDDGIPELSPLASDFVEFTEPDVYALAAQDPEIAAALQAMLAVIAKRAAAHGVL